MVVYDCARPEARYPPFFSSSINFCGGALGAALLNTIAASAAASYLAGHAPQASLQAATVHGDVIAFTFLAVLFAAGAVVTALLYPRRQPPQAAAG